ncbi:DNA helicase [Artemisia annua]|uniref:DNA helicase n=1 Tax=Artemisia annua TaxID=35608 RepID=A0A2U1QJ45_ARTAN|nr:DNA helicase [Artemisia annua]
MIKELTPMKNDWCTVSRKLLYAYGKQDCCYWNKISASRLALALVMLLRNIDQAVGLCNGTRLRILKLDEDVIEAQIITGTNVGHITINPQLKLGTSNKRLPLKINQRQFPLVLCLTMLSFMSLCLELKVKKARRF